MGHGCSIPLCNGYRVVQKFINYKLGPVVPRIEL